MLGGVVALASALLYSLGGVMQHRAVSARAAGPYDGAGLRRAAADPVWLAGLLVLAVALFVQLAALALAPLALVQTLLTTMVFWVILLAVVLERVRPGPSEYVGSAIVAVGVVGFLLITQPGTAAGASGGNTGGWAWATGIAGSLFIVTAAAARHVGPGAGAALLGAGAGVLNVTGAALAAAALELAGRDGVGAALGSWLPYGAAMVLVASIAATAMAFAAGPVTSAMPPMIAANPVVGLILGVVLLDQPWTGGAAAVIGAALAVGVIVVGTALLARSDIVRQRLA